MDDSGFSVDYSDPYSGGFTDTSFADPYSGSDLMAQFNYPSDPGGLDPLPAQFNTGTPDVIASRGMYDASQAGVNADPSAGFNPGYYGMAAGTPDYVTNRAGVPVGIDPATGQPTGSLYSQGGLGVPGGLGANNSGLYGQPGGFLNALTNPASLLGIGGGLAGLIGTLAGGGMGPKPVLSTPQKAALNQSYGANQNLGQFAAGQSPLQQQQASMLSALQQGQIPQFIPDLVRSAYSPVMQNLWTDATDAGRRAGFYDAPATSPAGGAVLGPALAQAQGQMAGDILKQATSFPALFNQPIQSQIGAAQNQATGFSNLGGQYTPQQKAPLGPQIGTAFGSGLQGVGQGINQQQNQDQQARQNSLLNTILMNQANQTNMSGAGGNWPQYGGL